MPLFPCTELNTMKHFIPPLVLCLYLLSCASREEGKVNPETSQSGKTVSFEKLDSIKIDYLGNPTVHDIDPVSGTVLFMEDGAFSQEIILADTDGNIINSFSKFGDMPDTYGKLMGPMRLLDGNSFLAYGYNGFMTYDFGGNLLSRIKLVDFEVPSRSRGSMGYGMEKLGNRYLYIDQGYPPEGDYSDIRLYEKIHLLKWLYPETGEEDSFIQFPESSIFRSGKYFFRSAWDPAYVLKDGRIYIAFGLEPVIYAFEDTPPYSLVSSTPIQFKEFRNFKGADSFTFEIEAFLDRYRTAFIENIKIINGHFVVGYFPGYDDLDLEESRSNKSPDEWVTFREKIKKKYPHRIAIVDSLGNVISDFVPEGLEAYSMLVRNGELWMREKPSEEVEEDCFRLFRVGLKFD